MEVPAERRGEVRRVGMRFKRASVADFDAANGTELASVVSLAHAIRDNDETAISGFRGRHFRFAKTNDTLKGVGLSGDYFTIRAGVILRHNDKDAAHDITPDEWADIADALTNKKPEIVERFGDRNGQYRIWTQATIGGRTAIVGAEVKNTGKDIDINAVQTVFGAGGAVAREENVVYPKSIEEIRSVLTRHNSGRYPESPQDDNSISQSAAGSQGGAEISPAEDAAYMDAVGRGDMETAQRMVREAAKQHGYKVAVFHGTPSGGFSVFKTLPAYVTENKEYADKYQSPTASSIRFGKQSTQPETKSLFLDPRRMFDTRRKAVRDRFLDEYVRGGEEWAPVSGTNLALSKRGLPDWTEAESIADYIRAKHLPYDSIVVDEGGYFDLAGNVQDRGISYAVLKGSKLKSADPVTYDDAGNVIPLSQRFNPENPDIRFKRNAAFEHSLDALQSIADGADYGVLHNAKYGEIRYPKGRLGTINAKGQTEGGMGFIHIVSERMRKDGATLEEGIDTAIRVGQAVEAGEETAARKNTRHFDYDGARAIVALTDGGNPIITGYEIRADEPSVAYPSADGRQPLSPDRIKEVVAALRDRIANLRAEVKGGMRFKVGGIYTGTAADYANRSRQGGVDDGPSLVKIGTGEGNQVYGWGLYGSTVRGVAERYATYRDSDHAIIVVDGKEWKPGKEATIGERVAYEQLDDFANTPEEIAEYCESRDDPHYKEAAKFIRSHKVEIREPHTHLYEQTFFTDRAPGDESHLLMWEEQIGLQKLKDITAALPFEKQKIFRSWLRDSLPYGNKPQHAWGKDVYEALSNTLEGPKSASEFLRDKLGYDGVKYPVGSYGSVRKLNGDKVGWNYVSFRDDNIRVDHKWTDGQMRYKLSAPVDDPEVLFGARESRKAHGLDDLTAEESGLAYTDKELYAAGQRIAKDVPHMMNVVNDALTSDRALPLEDTFALTVVHNLHSRTRNFTAESKSRLMNCEYCEYWICGEK